MALATISRVTGNNRAFRRVWLGATVSATGDTASWIALVALAIAAPQASIAVLAVCYTAPVAVGGLAAGWALDRFDRRRLLAADATVRAAVFALIPVSAAALTLGELAAAGLLTRRDWKRPLVPSILVSQLAAAALVTLLIADSAAVTILAMAALGFVSAPMTAWAQTLRMREARPAMHGRLFAVLRTAMQAAPPIGAAAAAALSHAGIANLIGCVATIMALPVLGGAFDLLKLNSTAPQAET